MTERVVSGYQRHMALMLANNPSISMLEIAHHWKDLSQSERKCYEKPGPFSQLLLKIHRVRRSLGMSARESDREIQPNVQILFNEYALAQENQLASVSARARARACARARALACAGADTAVAPGLSRVLAGLTGKDEETDLETQSCVICMTNQKVVALVPCGHTCYCIGCSKFSDGKGISTTCPICRAQVVTA